MSPQTHSSIILDKAPMHVGSINVIPVTVDFRFLIGYKMSVKYTL